MREVVWLEGLVYGHPLASVKQVTYPWSLIPVELDNVYMPKGQLSTFWSWVYGSYAEGERLGSEPCFPEPALYTPSMQDDVLQTGSVFGE